MGLPVTIKVNFRGNVKRFLAQDLDKLEWESVEAWIKASFGINHFQVKYFDEDNEEICINSQDEYEEAIKVLMLCTAHDIRLSQIQSSSTTQLHRQEA
ncbi:hypothetical protein INR49_005865 [Caranx melampygus]|nr:hypothetical protein INR49_005865 [Caranx melampygus]